MKTYTTIPYDVIESALNKLEAYIRPTYGPSGRGILVDFGGYQKMLDDGFMAIDEFELPDPLENAVIKFVKAASFQANKRAGDGTTTATLLMIAIVRKCMKSMELDVALENLSVGVAEAIGVIHSSKREITELNDLHNIAFNAYHDAECAEIVSKLVQQVGPDGVISVQGGEALETKSEVVLGMSIRNGFYSPYLSNEEGKVEIEDPYILVTTRRIMTNKELLPIIERIVATGKRQLLIVCDSMEGEALTTIVMNSMRKTLDVMVVRAPYSDVERKNFMEDLAIVTGATVADDTTGVTLENMGLPALGKATKVIITKDSTLIVDGQGVQGQLDSRVASVRELLKEQPNNDAIQSRLARLTGGVGVIKVGANTEAEIINKKAKVDDAVHATQLAYKTGVVAGGARALMVHTSSDELNEALRYPRMVLEANGMRFIDDSAEDAFGVVEAAIESAASIATLLLNCGGIITQDDRKTQTKL